MSQASCNGSSVWAFRTTACAPPEWKGSQGAVPVSPEERLHGEAGALRHELDGRSRPRPLGRTLPE